MYHISFFLLFSLVFSNSIVSQDSVSKLPQKRFYFKGETHQYPAANAESLFTLLGLLYRQHGVRYLVMERGPDAAYLANRYLREEFDSLPAHSKLYLGNAFWKKVLVFNRSLPAGQKIKVLGFDFNRYIHTSEAFRLMLGDDPALPDKELKAALKKIIGWDNVSWDFNRQAQFVKDMEALRKTAEGKEVMLKETLGDSYIYFRAILTNQTPATPNIKRDKKAAAAFTDALPELTDGNFLFNYGIAHVSLNGSGMAGILLADRRFENEVISIYPFYKEAKNDRENYISETVKKQLESYSPPALVDLKATGIYPKSFNKSQWVMVIKGAN
jgi:hypothetical protein